MSAAASARGRANRNKGARAERDLAKWLRDNGWPHAERGRNNGFRVADRAGADGYDITGCPGLLWDVKDVADKELYRVPGWLQKVVGDAGEVGALGLLVVKRRGRTDVGAWWVHCLLATLAGVDELAASVPVRLEMRYAAMLLRKRGFGESLVPEQRAS